MDSRFARVHFLKFFISELMQMLKVNANSTVYPSNPSPSIIKRNESESQPTVQAKKQVQENQKAVQAVEITAEKVKDALESFNKVFKPTHLDFQLHEDSGKYFVRVIDEISKEVLVQIPSEEFLQMVSEAKEQLGLLFDKRV